MSQETQFLTYVLEHGSFLGVFAAGAGLKMRMARPGFVQVISAYGLSERHHRYLDELKMLPGKGNTNDGKGKQQAKDHMHQRRIQPAA